MKNKSLVSKSRQPTKGGSLPASDSSSSRLWYSPMLGPTRDALHGNGEKDCRTPDENCNRSASVFLQRTILQLFSSCNGTGTTVESNGDGPWKLLPKEKVPEARSPSAARKVANRQSAAARVAAIPSRFPLWKRTLDLCLVFLTMCFWLPLMIFVICLIKIVSPGPTFYRQQRIGLQGRPFMIYKFRSMKVNAETQTHEDYVGKLMRSESPLTKLDSNDPRLILCGRFLRATGLDELPQLFNVLRGDMSLVGPRPCTVGEFERYLPWQKERVKAPPGLTGYWQVNGKNETTFNQMVDMDLYYAREMSLPLDLRIICKTLPAIFGQTLDLFGRRLSTRKDEKVIAVLPSQHCNGSTRQA